VSGDNRGDTTYEAPRRVVEEPSVEPPEKTAFLDNVTVTVEQDSLQRSVKATRLTGDLRLREPHYPRPVPSGVREPSNRIVTITLPDSNLLPRRLKSYERLPTDLLPEGIRRCPICETPKRSHIRRHSNMVLVTHHGMLNL